MKRLLKKYALIVLVLLLLMNMAAVTSADNYVGGENPVTIQSGTVSGGLFIDAAPPSMATSITKTFSLPASAAGNIQWARLYIAVYCGNMQENRQGTVITTFDGDGDGTYETALGTEDLNVAFVYEADGGITPVVVNDHCNRMTSDYLMWYDVTSSITGINPAVRAVTSPVSTNFDGRIKLATLIVAYNDGDSDQITYWVNQGHDVDSYFSDDYYGEDYIGSSQFSGIPGGISSAILTVNHLASTDGIYTFAGTGIPTDPSGGNVQGSYSGYNTWDVTSLISGSSAALTYDRAAEFYKISLATLAVQVEGGIPPGAEFSAEPLSGSAPLAVSFTDGSTGSPDSWTWEYREGSAEWTQFSTEQNPYHTFESAGTYDIRLTASNSAGSDEETKTGYIIVNEPVPSCDFTIAGAVDTFPSTLFAREPNLVRIFNVKNNGPGPSPATEVELSSSDGFTGREVVPALNSGQGIIISITDMTIRDLAGATVTYSAMVDPDNVVPETNEANNGKTSAAKTVTYNGYKGKRYWNGASDVTTARTFDFRGGILHSEGDSVYFSGSTSWTGYTVNWDAYDLPIPAGATVREAILYVPYNWDDSGEIPDRFHVSFNNYPLAYESWYNDKSNFGTYTNYQYGLLTYNVTSCFLESGNSAQITKDNSGSRLSMYGLTLAVIYEDASATRKQIFLNEEFDILGADESGYGTTPEEATAYIPFSGMTINSEQASHAYLTTFVPSGDGPEGDLLFNDNIISGNTWDYGLSGTQVAINTQDVMLHLADTGNEAGIQSTAGSTPVMAVSHVFLVVEYQDTAPVAAFTAVPTSGTAPLTVTFTDQSTNSPSSWTWEYRIGTGDWTQFSVDQSPEYSFVTAGSYDIRLTSTNAGGSDDETRTGYITVNEPVGPPVAAFTADPTSGTVPLVVQFTDESTGEISIYAWDFDNDGTTDSSDQNPHHIYAAAGTYTVKLTITGPGGSDDEIKTGFITVNDESSIEVSVTPSGISFGAMSAAAPSTAITTVSVTTTGTGSWSVTASDQKFSHKGYMTTLADLALEHPLELSNDGSAWNELSSDFSDFITGSGAGTATETAGMRQAVSAGDIPGDYSITITFTGAMS